MDISGAVILGLAEGITELLPISINGHFLLAQNFFALSSVDKLAFDVWLHFGIAAALIVYFWGDLWVLVQAILRKLSRLPVNERDLTLCYGLIIGALPALLVSFIAEPYIGTTFAALGVIAVMLFFAAVFFMFVEWRYYGRPEHAPVTIKGGLLVGFFQILSLVPGFSLMGAGLAGGMLTGLSRYEAARFSLLLTIPITLGLGVRECLPLLQSDALVEWTPVIVGVLVASVTTLVTTHLFLGFIKKHSLWPFIWYGVILAALLGYVSVFT